MAELFNLSLSDCLVLDILFFCSNVYVSIIKSKTYHLGDPAFSEQIQTQVQTNNYNDMKLASFPSS